MQMGPVGGPHLAEDRSAFGHHVGYPKGPPDLHELPPGYDDLFTLSQGVEYQKDSTGVVVDHHGGFGTAELQEQILHMDVTQAPASHPQVVLQVGITPPDLHQPLQGPP